MSNRVTLGRSATHAAAISSRKASPLLVDRLQALVFDFDGVIKDTEGPWMRAWQRMFERRGLPLLPLEWMRLTRTGVDLHRHLATTTGEPVGRTEVVRELKRARQEIAASPVLPGVVDLIEDAGRRGIRVGLATNADKRWLQTWLPGDVARRFDAICTVEDAVKAKPHPSPYATVMATMDVEPYACVAIEDSYVGARSALLAGAHCLFLRTELNRAYSMPGAMFTDSLDGMTVDRMHAMVNAHVLSTTPVAPPLLSLGLT